MAFNSSSNSNNKAPQLSERTGLTIDLHCDASPSPPSSSVSTGQNVLLSAKDFVASVCEQPYIADVLPADMTLREFSETGGEKVLQFSGNNMDIANNLPFCIEMAKQHVQQCDTFHSSSLPCPIPHASPSRHLSAPISPRNSSLGSQQHEAVNTVPSNSNSSGSQMMAGVNPQSARFNPLTRIFLRRTFSENTRRARAPSCNLGASAGSALLKAAGLGQSTRSPGLPHCSFGHELSNIVRLGGAAFGQSAPCLLTARDVDSHNNREFLSSSTHHVGGRLRSSTARRASHASGGPIGSATNDSTASTATSPTESPKPFGQSGHFSAGFSRCSNGGHRRWSVASLPGSSGYATEPGGVGSDGTSSIYTSNEGLPASPGLNPPSLTAPLTQDSVNAIRQRHHTSSFGAPNALSFGANSTNTNTSNNNSGNSLLSPRASGTSAFSSSDSNPVFEIQQQQTGQQQEIISPIPRPRLTRKHSTPSLCSLADDDVAILNSIYQECFPRAQRIMEDRLRSLIASEQANPIALPESMDGAFCFVHDQALQLAADCLRASELNQLSAAQFANLSSNLGQLAKQAKQKCPLSAQKLHRIIINILMAIARCARLCECLEFSPDSLKFENQLEASGQGIVSQVQGDVYRYVTEQLGDLVPAGLSGLDADVSFFNTSTRRHNNSNAQAPTQTPQTPAIGLQQRALMSTSIGSIAAPCEEDFEVVKNISNGAYGAVFLVRQKRTGQRFAMKRINKRCLALHNQCEQIWAERNILTFADNPFVVQMYCSFETPRHFCMVMEYVQGGDVASLLKKVRTIPVDLARVYFAEIVLALAYLHSYGIIHRDIKPDNLLITATGHIKLTDFGLSKIGLMNRTTNLYMSDSSAGYSLNSERLFKDKQVYGTPQYIAPEVILGQDYGKAVDWWSVGVVLYECLLGGTPFYGTTPQEVFHMIVYHDAIEWPDEEDPLYPTDDSRDIIENLLQNDPELRLGSGPGGANDVKAHAFYDSVDWTAVLWQKAEMLFVPQLDDEEDTGYFDSRADRYSHDDTAEDNEAMMQAFDMVFPPAGSCSPYDGNSPLTRSRVGSVVESLRSGGSNNHESTLMPPSCDATLAAATTPPLSDLMFHSFCSFSPRYARDSLSLISSSGESSPSLLTQSLSAADLNSARQVINSTTTTTSTSTSTTNSNTVNTNTMNTNECSSSPDEALINTQTTTTSNSTTAAVSLTSVVSETLGVPPSNARPVPVISVHSSAATPPSVQSEGGNILSMAAAKVEASQQLRRVRHAPSPSNTHQSKPLSLLIPSSSSSSANSSNQPTSHRTHHQNLGHTSSSPLSGADDRRISAGSDGGSSSSLSPLSPGGFAIPPPICPTSVTIKRGPHGFGFTFRTVRIREAVPILTPAGVTKTPNRHMKSRLQHQILSVQTNSPAAAAGLQPGHVIMAINEGSVDGHSHIDVLTRLVGSKHEVTVYTCEPEAANIMRQTPAASARAAARKMQMSQYRGGGGSGASSGGSGGGPTTTPASTMVHRKSFDPAAKSRSNLCRHASMSDPNYNQQTPLINTASTTNNNNNNEALSPSGSTGSNTSETTPQQQQVPQVKLTSPSATTGGRPSSSSGISGGSSSSRPTMAMGHAKLAASFSGSGGGSVRMQRALSQTMLPMHVQSSSSLSSSSSSGGGNNAPRRGPSSTTAPCRPQQLLTLPATAGGHYGSANLLSSSLPQGALSHALSSAFSASCSGGGSGGGAGGRPRSMRQLSGHNNNQQSSLHPSKADGPAGSSSSVSRRRSFHTMPSPLARTPSPLTGSSPTTGCNSSNNNASSSSSSGGQVNLTASLPITPISPQRACSPLVQEPGGSLRMRNISNRRVQSVYVPYTTVNNNYTNNNGSGGGGGNNNTTITTTTSTMSTNNGGSSNNVFPSESSSTTSLPDTGISGGNNNESEEEVTERKSESSAVTPVQTNAQPLVRRRLTTDDGTWLPEPKQKLENDDEKH